MISKVFNRRLIISICTVIIVLLCSFNLLVFSQKTSNMYFKAENAEWICTVEIEKDNNQYRVGNTLNYVGENSYEDVILELEIRYAHSANITIRENHNWSSGESCFAYSTIYYPANTDLTFITPTECLISINGDEKVSLAFDKSSQ